ncbi:MAG TPA: flagellin [Dongiaceae bacterium]|nr:flagellin [Dongiaceae bacterium]
MATNDIQLSAGIRSNLLLLQQTTTLLNRTQVRLATGNKVNSALDGPTAFFAAKGLNQRAGDLNGLKDGIGQAISTINAADQGITSIQNLVDQAKGLTTQALGNLGNDSTSVALRKSLADSYNSILRQIDKLAQDSQYQGKNLLLGSGLRLDATASSKTSTNAIAGISGAEVTNVVSADTYTISVTGDGAITGDTADIANAEQDRGISNLVINGFANTTANNFDPISIKLSGGTGKDKTFTITEGTQSITQTFTTSQWSAAKANNDILRLSVSFNSGTKVSFDVNFDDIEDVPDTAGVGTSTIQKNVNLQVIATNAAGETITRDGLQALGSGKVADGENAYAFDSGTARVDVDERTILQGSAYSAAVGTSYGTGAGAIVGAPTVRTGAITADETLTLTASAGTYDYATNQFDTYNLTLQGSSSSGTVTVTGVSAGTANSVGFGVLTGSNSVGYTLDTNFGDLKYIATAGSASDTEIAGTKSTTGLTTITSDAVSISSALNFADNAVTGVSITVTGTGTSTATLVVHDSAGNSASITFSTGTTATSVTIGGATLNLALSTAGITSLDTSAGSFDYKIRGDFTSSREAKFDVRGTNTGQTASLTTKQLVDGTDANNLTVQLNEKNTSTVTVVSQNVQTNGQGLQLDFAQNSWSDRSDIDNAIKQLDAATTKLRAASSNLSTNLNIIQTREDYTAEFANVLTEGATKLTAADQNEEGANILTLQTRQQLGTISLSLANQAQQAILRLF